MPDQCFSNRFREASAFGRFTLCTAVIFGAASSAGAVMPALSEDQARQKAVDILLGEPYGETRADVLKVITGARLVTKGETTICGASVGPAWLFTVSASHEGKPIKGVIQIAASGGALVCANLPFLD